MQVLTYIVLAAALFFAGSWAFGLIVRPDFRIKSTIATVAFWWLEIGLALAKLYSPFHLLWLMPLSLYLPGPIMMMEMPRPRLGTIALKTALLILPSLGLLVYFSR